MILSVKLDAQAPAASPSPPVRCAVYARVSVADHQGNGLTSIDVQVEACRAYIKSQRGLGWVVVEPAYKDEGVTGATLKRPGLRTLLDDIRQDKIDVVVVHRLDRLSRSLFDLSELIPLLRVQRVEFVSVTQQLDTQTPNGRLSLNLLTSFAEFEREIIGERTREKVAATRGKGLWQGKGTPLGYGVDFEQRLVVIAHEADLVRDVFRQYLGLDSMTELMELLQRRRVKNKKWITRDAKPRGGQLLDRTAVYRILGNRMYIGEAYFNGEWHSGVYPPIVDIELWNQAHAKLAKRARRKGVTNAPWNPLEFPLMGKLFWHDGRAYKFFKSSPRGKKHYLYYLAPNTPEEKASGTGPTNLPTGELHQGVIVHLRSKFKDPQTWLPSLLDPIKDDLGMDESVIREAMERLDTAWNFFTELTQAHTVFTLVSRVTLYPKQISIKVDIAALKKLIRELVQIRGVDSIDSEKPGKTRPKPS